MPEWSAGRENVGEKVKPTPDTPVQVSGTTPKKKLSAILTTERAMIRMTAFKDSCENGDFDALAEALKLLMVSHIPAPVWLCTTVLDIINHLRGQRKTGRKGPRSTEAKVIKLNRDDFEKYLVVQKIIDQAKQDGQKVLMKKIYERAKPPLQAAGLLRSERTIQESYLRIRRKIRNGTFRPEDYFPDDPEIAIELVGQSVQE